MSTLPPRAATPTRPSPVRLQTREQRKPAPDGQPGYLRIDSVHQDDLDGIKVLYLINTMTKISERFLLPLLGPHIGTFPFAIRGYHSDSGSEYLNVPVAKFLEKLRIAQTKTTVNALVESINGSMIRKSAMGQVSPPPPHTT